MKLSLPLANYEIASYVTVTREGWNFPKRRAFSSVVVSPSVEWFVANDELQAVICSFEAEDKYRLHGTLLFRQYGFDSSMLCFLGVNGTVSDFNSSRPSLPCPILMKNLHVTYGSEMVHVSFSSFDEVVLVSSNCCIGCIQLEKQRSAFMGHFISYRKLSGVVCCGIVPDSALVVILTREGLCGVVNFRDSALLSISRQGIFSELGLPSSCTAIWGVKADTLRVVVTFPLSRKVHVFVTSTLPEENENEHEKTSMNIHLESPLWNLRAHSYVRNYGASFAMASVWQNLVQFSVWQGTALSDTVFLENEMSVPYVSGCWVDEVFVVTRADGIALPFSICLNGEGKDGINIISHKHVDLTSCCSAILSGQSNYFLFLTLTCMESLCNGIPEAIFVTDSNSQRRFLQMCENKMEKPGVFLIDIAPFEEGIAVINVKCSGECMAFVTSASQVKSLFLAYEEKTDQVTCCLLYKRKDIIFVMGYQHGGINVWLSGVPKCVIPMVHTGAVDRIILLPEEKGHLEADFISVCTERGTVVVHHSETFECTRIFQSPCAPLTSLIWDPQTDYAYAISGSAGNLWHIPTCRLERVIYDFSAISEGPGRRDLLTSPEVGLVTIDRIVICGRTHFSLIVNFLPLIDTLTQRDACGAPLACRLALSILFSGPKCLDPKLHDLLGLPERGFNGGGFSVCTVSAEQSAKYLLAVVLLARALKPSAGLKYLISTLEVKALSDTLVSSGLIEQSPIPERLIIQALPLLLQVSDPAKKAIRLCIKSATEEMTSQELQKLFKNLIIMSSEELSLRQWFSVSTKLSEIDVWCYGFFVRMAFLGDVPRGDGIFLKCVLEIFRSDVSRLTEVLNMQENKKCVLLLLHTLREYCEELSKTVLSDSTPVVDAVATLAFGGEKSNGALAIKTLMSIASVEGSNFIENRLKGWYEQKRSWRPRIIAFFGALIESAPLQSYHSLPTIVEFLLRALDPHNPNKDERRSCLLPVTQVVRRAVDHLPNVSFQQHLQYLAVGNNDGIVRVINMKTTGIVASFVSHPEKILCVAYSSNHSGHDIAVLSEKMKTIKIWHASRPVGLMGIIFAGQMPEFRLKFAVDIPEINSAVSRERPDLFSMITKCRLRWLSPHCVELSSPWHDRIQLTVD
ncbi:hypothetical protein MOQ_007296 [Trypanosoma cruzi marinkellei]|uniref:Uncharacterized protein n=1 Tax=Trypanosoma cruzi marinkellei TaxID=85056 RepID=K2MP96_TRYCR|nr:hypothetical protein MOQ_007296 [Trypanosoma cruzi marinkellei]